MKEHKRKDATVTLRTTIPREQLVALCKQALSEESERWLRVDQDSPKELVFGLRGPYKESSRQFQWRVDIDSTAGATSLHTVITYYTQQRRWPFPATMLGLARYEKWMHRIADHVRAADPSAQISFAG